MRGERGTGHSTPCPRGSADGWVQGSVGKSIATVMGPRISPGRPQTERAAGGRGRSRDLGDRAGRNFSLSSPAPSAETPATTLQLDPQRERARPGGGRGLHVSDGACQPLPPETTRGHTQPTGTRAGAAGHKGQPRRLSVRMTVDPQSLHKPFENFDSGTFMACLNPFDIHGNI